MLLNFFSLDFNLLSLYLITNWLLTVSTKKPMLLPDAAKKPNTSIWLEVDQSYNALVVNNFERDVCNFQQSFIR